MGKLSTRKAVTGGVLTAAVVFGIGAAAAPEALAQLAIPGLPPINLPGVPGGKPAQNNIPGGQKNTGQGDQPGGGNGARDDQGAKIRSHQRNQQANPIPGLPPLPKPPQLPKPPRIKPRRSQNATGWISLLPQSKASSRYKTARSPSRRMKPRCWGR